MPLTVHSYFNIADEKEALSEIYAEHGEKALFIVPVRLDRDVMMKLICGETPYFGAGPSIWTASELLSELQRVTGLFERKIDPPDHRLILKHLISGFLEEAAKEGGELEPGYRHRGFVSVLGANIKDLLAEEVSPDSLRAAVGAGGRFSPEAVLAELYERYINYLDKYRLIDAAQVFTAARRKVLTEEGRRFVAGIEKIVFAGFLSFASSQLKLIKTLSEFAELDMFQPETGLGSFHDGILQLNELYDDRAKWSVPVVKIEAAGPQLEIEATARELALWACGEGALTSLGGFPGYGSVGLSVRPEKIHIAEYALSRYKIPYNLQEGGTAGDTQLGSLPQAVWRAHRSGWGNRETTLLLSSTLLFGSGGRMPEYKAESLPEGLASWLAALPEEASKTLLRADGLCRDFQRGVTPGMALALWRDFLKDARAAERAAETAGALDTLDSRVRQVAAAIGELDKKIEKFSDDAKNIGPASGIILKDAEAVSFIAEWSGTATLPVQLPQSGSVTVYAGPPPTLATHGCWIMTGVDANSWPGVLRESMLLGDDKKARFNEISAKSEEPSHLPELREEREQKEAVFRRVLATGRFGAVVTRAVYNEEGKECNESHFLQSVLESGGERSWKQAKTVLYEAESALPDGVKPWFPQAEVLRSPEFPERGDTTKIGRATREELPKIRVSDIDRWNACPYMYWCERILGFETAQASLYDRRKAGNLAHRVWNDAFRAKAEDGKISIQGYVMDNWTRFKGDEYRELDTDPRLARHENMLSRQIFDMAAKQDELEARLAKAHKIKTETEIKLDDYEFAGAIFTGRIDRVDYFENGFVVLDYKLGRSRTHEKELQAAAYSLILGLSTGGETLGFGWLGHTGPSLGGYFTKEYFPLYAFEGTAKKRETVQSRVDEALSVMEKMAASARAGEYPPKYDFKSEICRRCCFFTLCRKREIRAYTETLTEEGEGDDR